MKRFYPIGVPGERWGEAERQQWFAERTIERSYRAEVLDKLDALSQRFDVSPYGALPLDPERYPLKAVTARSKSPERPWVLITGGVHGYETSGVQGALAFLDTAVHDYLDRVNVLVAPCVSPWGYEAVSYTHLTLPTKA